MADAMLTEKRKTKANYASEILDARIIANYGDPGLDENYHFDVLSRYVVVMIESCQRVLTRDKFPNMLAIVKRPQHLWIDYAGGRATSTADQQRTDAQGNVSIGVAGSFSTMGISRIYPAYAFGESIRIRRLTQPETFPSSFFFSECDSAWNASTWGYGSWHSDGSTLSYFSNESMKASLQRKTILPISVGSQYFMGYLHKYHYEAFALYISQSTSAIFNGMASIFNGTWNGNPAIYSANGGYAFANNEYITLNAVCYEDINVNPKARTGGNEDGCLPLVVASPNNFPLPSARTVGSITYNPTYSPIGT